MVNLPDDVHQSMKALITNTEARVLAEAVERLLELRHGSGLLAEVAPTTVLWLQLFKGLALGLSIHRAGRPSIITCPSQLPSTCLWMVSSPL